MDDEDTEVTPMPTPDGVLALPDEDTALARVSAMHPREVVLAPVEQEPDGFDQPAAFEDTAFVIVSRRAATEAAWPPPPRTPALKSAPPGRHAEVFLAVPDIDLVSLPRSTDRHRAPSHSDWFWAPPTPH